MGVLEQVIELKGQGIPENEIIGSLREQGVSPGEINNALNQAKIKNAVSSERNVKSGMEPSIMGPEGAEPPPKELPTEGRVTDMDLAPISSPQYQKPRLQGGVVSKEISEEYVPSPQEGYGKQGQYPESQYPESQYPESQYQPEQSPESQYQPEQSQEYSPQEYGYPTSGVSDTDTLIEIAEQVFFEKIKVLQKQIENLNEFKVLAQTKIENISDRLKRIEFSIDNLQAEILEKVGSYGRGLEGVKKEMGMVQESFGKIINTLADKKEIKHQYPKAPTRKKVSKPVKKSSRKR